MNQAHITRYRLELDIVERDATLDDRRAIALLQSEFMLAINASYFMRLSGADMDVEVCGRSALPGGVGRYELIADLEERTPAMTDQAARELLRRAFGEALNASYFRRICVDDLRVVLIARERVAALRAA